jgi:hypothetical protein
MSANSYGVQSGTQAEYAYGLYDTINGEWMGTWFRNLEDAQSWVQTQDDKAEESGEDWTEDGTYSVVSTTDDEDVVF